jgi:multidrug efflux system membrane fusion protein
MNEPTVPNENAAETAPNAEAPQETVTSPKAEASPKKETPPAPRETHAGRKVAGKLISLVIIFAAVVLALCVWNIIEQHPRTDDATVRANVVGIVSRVRGLIVNLHVQDNQAVKEGDVLFEIDPEDYKLSLEKANAALAALDRQIEAARGGDAALKFAVKAAEAGVERSQAQLKQADDTHKRLQPLLPKGFATAEQVETAQTAKQTAAAALATAEQQLNQAKVAIGTLDTLTAQRSGALAAVKLAELELSYCKVAAPFPGRVISLNISEGAYASAGVAVFSLLDTRHWYVMADFREAEIRHMTPGTVAEVYLLSAPEKKFRATVQGISWAVKPEGEIDLPHGVPYVKRELNWVHIAQRFPVRLEVESPDPELFRMGASAVVIIKGPDAR